MLIEGKNGELEEIRVGPDPNEVLEWNILIGKNARANGFHHCVVIGHDVEATKDYQLIIGNSEIEGTRDITDAEYQEMLKMFTALVMGF